MADASNQTSESSSPDAAAVMESPPVYQKIEPILGWSRHYGDSARSVSQWIRWWKYLRLKDPVLMRWTYGLLIRIYPHTEINRALFVRGIYDPNAVVVASRFLPPSGGVFIDVGANNGYFSMLISKNIGNGGCVYALEPSSREFSRLVDNIKINGLEQVICAHKVAVSDQVGVAKLKIAGEEENALNTLGSDFASKGVENAGIENVATVSIDEFVSSHHLPRVDCIKLDVEGSELRAMNGARRTILTYHPVIILGVNDDALKANETDRDALQRIIAEFGYVIYKLVESPQFALQLVNDFAKEKAKVVYCLPQGITPPPLPQPEEKSFVAAVQEFFQ
ncbi:MAG: FkbM family methyltransferase [Holosporaceae bacterium]|nr:FkbM family methyltransferase [Holosporaceae bacterium]